MYTLTAYFVHPGTFNVSLLLMNIHVIFISATICTVGRSIIDLEHQGTGTGLFIQNGTNPRQHFIQIPLMDNQLSNTKWTRGACFKTMGNPCFGVIIVIILILYSKGVHYWYDNHLNINCSTFLPNFLLYNRGQLSAFGWDIMSKTEFSRRTEFPPKAAILVSSFNFITFILYNCVYLVVHCSYTEMYAQTVR
jgi:hypothetical protein